VGSVVLTAGLTAASVWLAGRSRMSRYWISPLLLVAAIAGFVLGYGMVGFSYGSS
jgi:hypothetical protein